jgi:predicted ATPase/DNA-binding SARP family transcriptional activator
MYVKVLGPVAAETDGTTLQLSANQRLLLAVLAAHPGRVVSVDLLTDALWGDEPPRNPAGALQNLVSRLRARLGAGHADALVTRPPGYGLFLDPTHIDRSEFERQMAAARGSEDPRAAVEIYRRALQMWRSGPYADFADNDALRADAVWLAESRVLAREEYLTLLVQLDHSAAVPELEALVADEPFRERPTALLMEALHRSGRQRDALLVYRWFCERLVDEFGLDPPASLAALETSILHDELEALDPQRSPALRRGQSGSSDNLTVRRTSFIGRDEEVSTVRRLVHDNQLVSLIGAGGAGKTSLAVEVARAARERFDDGVWVIDLLELSDSSHLPEHVATTIGLPTLSPEDPLASLVDHLRQRSLLLVLDNCEHLIDGVARCADVLLDGCDAIRILATSREPLRLSGEVAWRVEPLDVPSPSATTVAEILEASSGRLFVERVNGADVRFRPSDDDSLLIGTICRRLDGLPLAIELAAARVPQLGLAGVADRLDDRFSVLTANHRTALAHHQTLRAAIAWSVDLLEAPLRLLLARLSTFVGGFDLDAAVSVCSDVDVPAREVPDALAGLVERSLVAVHWKDGAVRYHLLETIREYAASLVDDSGTRQRHLRWCSELATAIGDGFLVHTDAWYRRLRMEFPNLRAAFRWAMDEGRVSDALHLAASLRWSPFNTGELYREHREWIEEALSRMELADADDAVVARGLVAAGAVAGLESRPAEAVEVLGRAMEVLQGLGDQAETTWCHMWLGAFHADLGDFDLAVGHTGAGLAIARSIDAAPALVYLANQHAENAMAAGVLRSDERYLGIAEETYALAAELAKGHLIDEGWVRALHGQAVMTALEDPALGLARCQETLVEWRRLGHGNRLIVALVSTARVALRAGEACTSAALLDEAIDVMTHVGWGQPLGRLLETTAVAAVESGSPSTAALLAGAASQRFLTPRWFVPIDADRRLEQGRSTDRTAWDLGLAAGAMMSDRAVMDLARAAVDDVQSTVRTGARSRRKQPAVPEPERRSARAPSSGVDERVRCEPGPV